LAGEGAERGNLESMVASSGIAEKFTFLGMLGEEEVREKYQELDLFLMTSYKEGTPLSLMEASALELPIVATDVGGVTEIITHGKNGLIAEAGDVETIANHVLSIARDPSLAASLAKNAREVLEASFSVKAKVKDTEAVYEELLASRGKS
jgi:glycosyltransferase involved in cell wall biosynthesis